MSETTIVPGLVVSVYQHEGAGKHGIVGLLDLRDQQPPHHRLCVMLDNDQRLQLAERLLEGTGYYLTSR